MPIAKNDSSNFEDICDDDSDNSLPNIPASLNESRIKVMSMSESQNSQNNSLLNQPGSR